MRRMCVVKLIDKKSTKDLMLMLDLNETIDQLAAANSVRWHGHILRKDKKNFLRRALDFEVKGMVKRGRRNKTWLRTVVEQSIKVGLSESDHNNRSKWSLWVNTMSNMMRYTLSTPLRIRKQNRIVTKLDYSQVVLECIQLNENICNGALWKWQMMWNKL